MQDAVREIVAAVNRLPEADHRHIVAIAGPPAAGKTTIARRVVDALPGAALLQMDGFHLDNAILSARGLLSRKGAPDTFDLPGLRHLLTRLRAEPLVYGPSFDRDRDVSVGSSVVFDETTRVVVVEGNYLLLDAPGWRELQSNWDLSIFVKACHATLEKRLIDRWLEQGLAQSEAVQRVESNDLKNAELVLRSSHPADVTVLLD